MRWSNFKPWEAISVDTVIGKLRERSTTPPPIYIEKSEEIKDENITTSSSILKDPEIKDDQASKPAQVRVTRSMANESESVKKDIYAEFDKATGKTLKVTGDIVPLNIVDPTDEELGGNKDVSVNYIWTDEIAGVSNNIGGIDELFEFYLMHTCIQSDPGEPKRERCT